jgi:crotonobetainyl-CoA:carnitine CoA-transferase CaiB-like acyl-CoA transferase
MALLGGKIPFGPVHNVAEILEDPHIAAREMIQKVDHPGLERQVAIAGIAVKMSDTPGRIARRAPLAGEHTDEILRELGIAGDQAKTLRTEGAVG